MPTCEVLLFIEFGKGIGFGSVAEFFAGGNSGAQLMQQLQLRTCVLAVYVRHAEMALLEGEGAWGYSLKIGYPSGWIVMYMFDILFYYF